MGDNEKIKSRFKPSFLGIIETSGGYKKLLLTRFHFVSLLLSIIIFVLYLINIKTVKDSFDIINSICESAVNLLGGIVGLSLAGLTLIITFGNPDMITRGAKHQYEEYIKNADFNVSYFQRAIAKFAFIVLFQIVTLLLLFFVALIQDMEIAIDYGWAWVINSIIFFICVHFLMFSLILVVALIFNLFSFSQTSNLHHLLSNFTLPDKEKDEDKTK